MDRFKAVFFEEATTLINELERVSLLLHNNPSDSSITEQIFRIMHTLKGNSTMFGFYRIGDFTHHFETLYDYIREGKMSVTDNVLNITFASVDHLRVLLTDVELENSVHKINHENLIRGLIEVLNGTSGEESIKNNSSDHKIENKVSDSPTYWVKFVPEKGLVRKGTNVLFLLDDLSQLGATYTVSNTERLPDFKKLDPAEIYLSWEIYVSGSVTENSILDVFMFVEEDCELEIRKISETNLLDQDGFSTIARDVSLSIDDKILKFGGLVKKSSSKSRIEEVRNKMEKANERSIITSKDNSISSIRVASEKLDELMSLVSELVTTQARLNLVSEQIASSELISISENIEKITRQLRDNTFSICLIPIENLLVRFQRLVRDLSTQLNKDVVFVSEGADTELDKNIIENLADPLMHIFRNSLDHGIESGEERVKKGKPAQGKILLKAFYSGNSVIIQIRDDGKGIDPEMIRQKAISKGLITADQNLDRRQIFDLIFLPGFSTAEKVTEVSGRGVGMDVVKRQITEIRGEVEVESVLNEGTTINIKLPLTLSIIDGLLVKINATHFVIPLGNVDKCFEANHEEFVDKINDLIILDGEQVPFIYLRDEFDIKENCPQLHQVVVVKQDDRRVALSVDTIIGEYQAVLKPLGRLYKSVDVISGATILGNGEVALVVDPNRIIKEYIFNQIHNEVLQ
ncbi:chemotaxis protein CheA [Sporocytophaga myxococcoides]|uniref:Chemotaxis protein CheA n=1 Tax=Sporocytophaga myxococcoides TaxID=153721 RepID=A0A098LNG7_9BACT|nr:chemotaxis protein CheA [Sporocytophaga myxococcoides]GAL87658.1 chemotaxis protein CheA [Sporocytophaga myxococcoides]